MMLWLIIAMASNVAAAHEARWLLQTSVFTAHYEPEPDHNNRQQLIGLEYTKDNDWLPGGARFLNSFSQQSTYIYTGRRFSVGDGPLFAKLTGGFLHGYRGEHEGKIPFNRFGIAPR